MGMLKDTKAKLKPKDEGVSSNSSSSSALGGSSRREDEREGEKDSQNTVTRSDSDVHDEVDSSRGSSGEVDVFWVGREPVSSLKRSKARTRRVS